MKFIQCVLLLILTAFTQIVNAQNKKVDSLQLVIQKSKNDTNKVKTYFELIKIIRLYDYEAAMKLANEQLILSKKLNYYWGAGKAHNSMGLIHATLFHPDSARWHYILAANEFKKADDYGNIASVYSNISMIYSDLLDLPDSCIRFCLLASIYNEKSVGDTLKKLSNKMFIFANISSAYYLKHEYDSCLIYNDQTMKIAVLLNNDKVLADCFGQVASVNLAMKQYSVAFEYSMKALPLYEKEKMVHSIAQLKSSLGIIYHSMGNYKLSRKYAAESNELALQQNDSSFLAQNYMILGLAWFKSENFIEAIQYFAGGLEICKRFNNPFIKQQLLQYTGESWFQLKNYDKAISFLSQAADYSNSNKTKFECYEVIAESYEKKQDYRQAYNWFTKYHELEKAIVDSAKSRTVNELIARYEFEKKQQQIERLANEKEINSLVIIRQQQDILSAQLLSKQQQQSLDMQTLLLQKNNTDIEKKSLAIKASYTQLQSEKKQKQLQAEIIEKENLQKKLVYSGAALIAIFSVYIFYRYRRRRKLQSEQEMLNERLRISRELHDDMGSTLGSISIYSEVAKNRSAKNENTDEAITKIGVASRELIDKMSDIVWSINPNNESMEQLQNRMQAFAAMLLTPHNIQYSFLADEAIKKVKLTAEERKNIFLIFKETIHNIIKYAECKKAEINLSMQNNQFEMQVKDDGKGFDVTKLTSADSLGGNGIKNMKARAESMHAMINIKSGINKGTIILLKLNG